jgi:RNA polymerase sigma-70 factor (ECF subfamily)
VEDLALACAATFGEDEAMRTLEQRQLPSVDVVLRRKGIPAADLQDLRQVLLARLCVPRPGEKPRIAQYAGKGTLQGWLRVVAVREAQAILEKGGREQLEDVEVLTRAAMAEGDHEMAYLKARYGEELKASFAAAMAMLEPRDRNVLRYSVIEGLSIDRIADLYQVHRATAARWLEAAREHILKETRRDLMARLAIDRSEFESIARLVQSQLDVSLSRLLK